MIKRIAAILIVFCCIFAGCKTQAGSKIEKGTETIVPWLPNVEPTAVYDWMAGESPVPVKRMGVARYGVSNVYHAISPSGIYFMQEALEGFDTYIWYVDHGSNQMIKLCGRADCMHDSPDCNAYVYDGRFLSYYGGYLYAVSGGGSDRECKLIRMNVDGTNRVTVLDMLKFSEENGGDGAQCEVFTEGVLLFHTFAYTMQTSGGSTQLTPKTLEYYLYRLDGSTPQPVPQKTQGVVYNCGDMVMGISAETRNGGELSIWKIDLQTDTSEYLTDHPGVQGYYAETEGYYFKDGAIRRFIYETQTEEILVDTGLEGNYVLRVFPDCLVVAANGLEYTEDNHFYVYNWGFELVDTIEIPYQYDVGTQHLLISETAERFILSTTYAGFPRYYINKSELGTGNVKVHAFVLP